ncbi:helix-turn-helix domain-containing protein [Rariglobus hedericola]|uniref:AraC family transcriptional regulator n=1 Tax=Rariglobus hedericola TaxID=2597822 RepID=A0A556QJQ2_9BACT|nr:AraC family transcriptional regulator [Rariglobus hedericola]TSJ76859.1 AraC family transcriptional regulator [Rariglobus hedericola]
MNSTGTDSPKSLANHFRVSGHAQDRIKLPGVFWAGLKAIGLSPTVVLRHSELPPTVYSGETFVTTPQNFAIWRSIRELSGDPTMGWKFMSQVETDQYHPTLLAALHARTYRESIERLARYKQLCSAEEFRFTPKGDEMLVEVSWPFAEGVQPPVLLIDAVFALVTELGRRGTKTKLTPKRIELTRPAERDNGLADYFGCPVKYRATRDALVLRTADLALPFATHNDELLQMLAPQFETQLQSGRIAPGTLAQVKWILKRLLSGSRPDLPMVAKELGMSDRTLQRRITDEGTTFRQLLNETRHELVRHYLGDPTVEITEAAFLVGYEDPTSFYRAFRAWEGTTPAEWRAAHLSRRAKRN